MTESVTKAQLLHDGCFSKAIMQTCGTCSLCGGNTDINDFKVCAQCAEQKDLCMKCGEPRVQETPPPDIFHGSCQASAPMAPAFPGTCECGGTKNYASWKMCAECAQQKGTCVLCGESLVATKAKIEPCVVCADCAAEPPVVVAAMGYCSRCGTSIPSSAYWFCFPCSLSNKQCFICGKPTPDAQ